MSVTTNEPASAAAFNSGFLSRDSDSDTTGKVGLANTDAVSGDTLTNAQLAVNRNAYKYLEVSGSTVISSGSLNTLYGVDTSGGGVSITLPDAADSDKFFYSFKLIDATNSMTINTTDSQTIDGEATLVYSEENDYVKLTSDGSNWLKISGGASGSSAGGVAQWETSKLYSENDLVIEADSIYICKNDHTSGTFATDFANGDWVYVKASPMFDDALFEIQATGDDTKVGKFDASDIDTATERTTKFRNQDGRMALLEDYKTENEHNALELYRAKFSESISDISLSGNNAEIFGGGTIDGTLSISTTSNELLLSDQVYKYDAGASSENDYFGVSHTLLNIEKDKYLKFFVGYKNDATTSDNDFRFGIEIVGGTAGSITYHDLPAVNTTNNSGKMFEVLQWIPEDATSVKYGVQSQSAVTTIEKLFDNLGMSLDSFVKENITEMYSSYYRNATGTGWTVTSNDLKIDTIGDITNEGAEVLVPSTVGNSTRWTATKEALVTAGGSISTNLTNSSLQVKLNGTVISKGSVNVSDSLSGSGCAPFRVQTGDYIEYKYNGSGIGTKYSLYLNITAQAESSAILTPAKLQQEYMVAYNQGNFYDASGATDSFNEALIVGLSASELLTMPNVGGQTRITATKRVDLDINFWGYTTTGNEISILNSSGNSIGIHNGQATPHIIQVSTNLILEKDDYIYVSCGSLSTRSGGMSAVVKSADATFTAALPADGILRPAEVGNQIVKYSGWSSGTSSGYKFTTRDYNYDHRNADTQELIIDDNTGSYTKFTAVKACDFLVSAGLRADSGTGISFIAHFNSSDTKLDEVRADNASGLTNGNALYFRMAEGDYIQLRGNQILTISPSTYVQVKATPLAVTLLAAIPPATDTEAGTVSFEKTETINLTGVGSYTGGTIKISRVGDNVTIVAPTALTHSNASSVDTGAGLIPTWARPADTVSNIYICSAAQIYQVVVTSAGLFRTAYFNSSLAASNATSAGAAITISYAI